MSKLRFNLFALLLALITLSIACVSGPPASQTASTGNTNGAPADPNKPIRIGFLMDTLKEERWTKDRDLFLKRAQELGATVDFQVANGDDKLQNQQAENLLTKGIDVLVVVPHNGTVAGSIVEAAKRQNVPVIAYDRMIMNSDVDLYVSHQVERIGEMQAQYALDKTKGNFLLIGGSPTDNNAVLLIEGQKRILNPATQNGQIKIVGEQMSAEWKDVEAMKNTENALTQNNDNIQAVIASNDGTARGVIQALKGRNLVGKVIVTGQDAELAALQSIAAGEQTMTIYKPIQPLAYSAVESAIKLARREAVTPNGQINNKRKDVPAVLQDPITVDKDNIMQTIVKDGYASYEDIYKNVPEANRPPR